MHCVRGWLNVSGKDRSTLGLLRFTSQYVVLKRPMSRAGTELVKHWLSLVG